MNKHPDNAPEGIGDGATVALLPCPFCGSTTDSPIETVVHMSMSEHDWREPSYTVQCDNCAATTGLLFSEDDAAAAWNRRTATAANGARLTAEDVALIDEIEAALAKATPGPWNHLGYAGQDGTIQGPRQVVVGSFSTARGTSGGTGHQAFSDAAATVALRNAAPRLIALARLAITPAPDTGDAMVEALRKHVATLADELEYALRDRYRHMLGYPEIERRFAREMASVIEAREALATPAVDETADEGPTRAELLEMDLAQTNALVDHQANKLSRLQGHFASMIIDPDVCAVAKDIARAALNRAPVQG